MNFRDMFCSRGFWQEFNISKRKVTKKYIEYFGENDCLITDRKDAISKLNNVVALIQKNMVERINVDENYTIIKDLCGILNECHKFYIMEKEIRTNLIERNVSFESITDVLEQNRNICRDIIDSTNIWIENCLLLQKGNRNNIDGNLKFDCDLMIDIYIYGLVSRGLSLLVLSKKFKEGELYYGIKITPTKDIPIDILRDRPVIYFNPLMSGNQNVLSSIPLSKEANSTDFGIGFKNQFNVEFLLFLSLIQYFQIIVLRGNESGMVIIDKELFIQKVELATNPAIKVEYILENFTLTKRKIETQLNSKDPIIWIMGANKIRYELCPFILLENNKILITYGALEQSKQLWVSIFSNGGSSYTNTNDILTTAIAKRNKELSDILINEIRNKLRKHYNGDFDEIEVKYNRIFGERDINYGDFDLVFYTKDTKELFLIEAKYFSDSLNSSGMVTDYQKLFKENGYYDKCRRRYDLVLSESEKLKSFLGIADEVNVHLLFLSSKPLEIEFQDEDGVVNFVCLSIFDKYLEGKLISEDGNEIVRPTHVI